MTQLPLPPHPWDRFVASLAAVSAEFLDGCSSHAPEERVTMGEKAVNTVHHFLETIAKEIRSLMQRMCEERIKLSSSVSRHLVAMAAQQPQVAHSIATAEGTNKSSRGRRCRGLVT